MTVAVSGDSITFPDNSVQATAPKVGMVNRIINGAMVIDQRNEGASVTPAAGTYLVDRWAFYVSQASKITAQQNKGAITPPTGFSNYLGISSSSAYSLSATDQFTLYQKVEGFNFADMAWGTASAAAITLSFRVYSSLTGTFGGSLQNSAGNRCYPFSYAVPVANTWTTVSVTIAGDTAGTWVGATNGVGVTVNFSLGAGSTYSGTAGAWVGADYITSATGAVSVVGTSGATFYITGVQLEKGSTATSFDYRPYGTELALCQRYYWKWNGTPSRKWVFSGMILSTTVSYGVFHTKQTMRAQPTMGTSGTAGDYCLYQGNSLIVCNAVPAISASDVDTPTFEFRGTGMTDGRASLNGSNNDNGFITLSAEL